MNHELLYCLEKLEMIGDSEFRSGLVSVRELKSNKNLPPEEYIALENANKYKANYVYFRRFESRPSVPQIYLYDFTDNINVKEEDLTNIHKQLYSSGLVPMFFIFTKKDVRIFNCFERPSEGRSLKYTPLTIIKLASNLSDEIDEFNNEEEFKAFSGKSFDNGTFWENSKYSNKFNFNNSAYEKLLGELKQALKDIISNNILPSNIARKMMVVSILIKYLEEREDEFGNKVFPSDFFSRFGANSSKFTDVLKTPGSYLKLLDYLSKHFNGGVFELEEEERNYISNQDLSRFGQFLDGDTDGIQFVFWRLYSFNDLPVELISNIYEEFLGKQPGVVYTPPYLVNFLLDEAMPLSNENTEFKILDPSCGSGVFLVGAYRRLIYRWRRKNNWRHPDLVILKKLLKDNIFGVELKKEAAQLTVFSLSLALCDELTPLQIWKDLQFDDLQKENIIHDDFFNVVLNNKFKNKFDLVIGNPPFEAKLTKSAEKVETISAKERTLYNSEYNFKLNNSLIKLPDNQISLLFLEKSIDLCKINSLVCLIQPSGPLLYNNSSFLFRKSLLKKYNVPQIIDFTSLSEVLYGNAKVATAAIFVKNEKPKNKSLLHVTVRRTKAHKEKLFFELDTYDFHNIPYDLAINDSLVWKSNFIGGSRYHQLIKRLADLQTFEEFLLKQKETFGWEFSEGFTAAIDSDIKKISKLENDRQNSISAESAYQIALKKMKAHFLTGKRHLPVEALSTSGIDDSKIEEELSLEYFHSKGNAKVYLAPHLLIKEVVEASSFSIPVEYRKDDLVFKNSIFGIHGHSEESLLEIKKRFSNNQLYPFYLAGISGRYMVNKSSSLLASDLKKLPYPEFEDDLKISEFESILISDFGNYILEFRRKGENSKIAKNNVSKSELNDFANIFCRVLEGVFNSIKPYKYFETDSYICYPFYFGSEPNIDFSDSKNADKYIENLVRKNSGVNLRLTRIVRIYEGNVIYLIKPKKLRYWLKSIALKDADDTFSDLRKQGY